MGMGVLGAFCPPNRPLHRIFDIVFGVGKLDDVIENHRDIRAKLLLDLYASFGSQFDN